MVNKSIMIGKQGRRTRARAKRSNAGLFELHDVARGVIPTIGRRPKVGLYSTLVTSTFEYLLISFIRAGVAEALIIIIGISIMQSPKRVSLS